MKRLTYLLIFVASFGYSQNNLVFNKVLNFRLTTNQTATVPADKAWKIEGNPGIQFTSPNPEYGISNGSYSATDDVVWLAEGTTITGSTDPSLSILEFDVVPVSTTSTSSGGLSSEGLQFSRVINYSDDHRFPTSNLFWHDYEPIEIPEGKVWKITSINVSSMSISLNPDVSPYMYRPHDQTFVTIGDIISVYEEGTNGYGAYPYNNRSEEIWLNEGLKTIKVTNGDSEKIRLTFTAIEYNIPQ